MPIKLDGGSILLDSGSIALHDDCCCCACSSNIIRVTVSGVTAGNTSPGTVHNGTYDIPMCVPTAVSYEDTNAVSPNNPDTWTAGEYKDVIAIVFSGVKGDTLTVSLSSCAKSNNAAFCGATLGNAYEHIGTWTFTIDHDASCNSMLSASTPSYNHYCYCSSYLLTDPADSPEPANVAGASVSIAWI